MKITDWLGRQPRGLIIAAGLIFSVLIGFLDYRLPYELTVFVFYAVPILLVSLYGTRQQAAFIAVFCTVVWWIANYHSQPNNIQTFLWVALNRLVSYFIVAVAGISMQQYRNAVMARLRDMERTRELEEAIVRVSEREQMRIGQDLHDGLCQHLAALDCAVTCLKQDLEEKGLEEADAASFIQKQLSQALLEARNLARGIFPVQINEEGFLAALQELVAVLNRLRQVKVTLEVFGAAKIREPQVSMHLYRIAQEALNNVIKHAKATKVDIIITRDNDHLTMKVRDNGVGLNEATRGRTRGLGMQTMKYRATSFGGDLDARRLPEGGTEITCRVPLAPELDDPETTSHELSLALHEN